MPPLPPAQNGSGKRAAAQREMRQSRSRNTTPSSVGGGTIVPSTETESKYLELTINPFPHTTYDEIIDPQGGSSIPDSKTLDSIIDILNRLLDVAETRSQVCDRGMRLLSIQRKEQVEADRREQEQNERTLREAADEAERGRQAIKNKKKKEIKDSSRAREERPLTHGAHGVAAQDGSNIETKPTSSPSRSTAERNHTRKFSGDGDSASSSLSPVQQTTPPATGVTDIKIAGSEIADDDDSSDEHQPPPAPAVPHLLTFGDDPWEFPDPTVYEIRDVKPGMPDDEIKQIYSVADYPHDDLHDLIPGTPPDKDFSSAKPSNQVQATTFAAYADQYMRPFTEEDLAFLRDRGDRTGPFLMPRRGKKHYTEVWAEEDGAMSIDNPRQGREKLPANQARGSVEDLDDDIAETDEISVGPLSSRLLSLMRPEHRAPPAEIPHGNSNGDLSMNGDLMGDFGDTSTMAIDGPLAPLSPATHMADSNTEAWKKANHTKLDHAQVEQRLKQELRFLGFVSEDADPDYDAAYDDDVAARLRALQAQLKEQSIFNGARKARLTDIVKASLAHQEYEKILEDLDSQVQTAFSKRTRTMGKSKKAKRPGGAGGGSHFVGAGSVARPGIGDMTKTLMDRRNKWIDGISPIFDGDVSKVPRVTDKDSSIFKDEDMAEYITRERDGWDEDLDEE